MLPVYELSDNLVMLFRPGRGSDMVGYATHRRGARKPYTSADRLLAKVLIPELRRSFDAGELSPTIAPVAGLPPRAAQVLQRLLRGQSPKQIATELGLSVFTVRDHVKLLLERFHVSSTPELLAYLLNDPQSDQWRAAVADRAKRAAGVLTRS